jgi:hypothetical protein
VRSILKLNRLTPGEQVIIVRDIRKPQCGHEKADGQTAVYEGQFPVSVTVRLNGQWREMAFEPFANGEIQATTADGRNVPLADVLPQVWLEGEHRVERSPLYEGTVHVAEGDRQAAFYWVDCNPRFTLPDGSCIWGYECWWGLIEGAPETQAEREESLDDWLEAMRTVFEAAPLERIGR